MNVEYKPGLNLLEYEVPKRVFIRGENRTTKRQKKGISLPATNLGWKNKERKFENKNTGMNWIGWRINEEGWSLFA